MKKSLIAILVLVLLVISVASMAEDASSVDLNNYSFQELVSLRQQIDARLVQLSTEIDHSAYSLDGLVYVSNGSEIRINLYEGTNTDLVIPSEIDGIPVTQIHPNAFKGNKTITSIVLPEGMTEIPKEFFADCTKLESVSLPKSVTKIGWWAFNDTYKLKNIVLHEGITELSSAAFQRAEGLEGVIVLPKSLTTMGDYAFSRCDKLDGAIIQSNLTVYDCTFSCERMKFIYVCEGNVVSFEGKPFDPGLEVAILPDTVTQIADGVFENCNRLTIVCPAGSYAEKYAKNNFIMCDTEHYSQYVEQYNTEYLGT